MGWGPGYGRGPSTRSRPLAASGSPASGAASRGGSNADPTDPGGPHGERQPHATKAHTPRLQKLPVPRTPAPTWALSTGPAARVRSYSSDCWEGWPGPLHRRWRGAGDPEETRQEKWSPPSSTLHRVTSDKEESLCGDSCFLICQTREWTHIHRPRARLQSPL